MSIPDFSNKLLLSSIVLISLRGKSGFSTVLGCGKKVSTTDFKLSFLASVLSFFNIF